MNDKKTINLKISQTPTMFSDFVNIAIRKDGCILLQFASSTPDMLIENVRTIMPKDTGINLLDTLSKLMDYYPSKQKLEPES